MNKICLTVFSSLAFAGAITMMNVPYSWSAGTSTAPSGGSDARMQKPSDSPAADTGMQGGTERQRARGQLSNEKTKQIQEALKSKGFDPGTADGVIGPKTSQAIRDFQKSTNLQVTGRIDDKTANALGVGMDGMGSSTDMKSSGSPNKSGSQAGGEPVKPSARGGSTIDPPSKPSGRE
jgi:peptidoglycan hydrolase-like protein with peptidoglycan-binding domain